MKIRPREVGLFKQCPCRDTLLTGSRKCRAGLSSLFPWATFIQGPKQKQAHSHACWELLLCMPAKSKHNLTEANLFLPLCLNSSLWVCVGCCVRAKAHPSPMSLCAHTHTWRLHAHTRRPRTHSRHWRCELDPRSPADPSGAKRSGV